MKDIFKQKVKGSQFPGKTWEEFVELIFTYFIPTINRPLKMKLNKQPESLFDVVPQYYAGTSSYYFDYNLTDLLVTNIEDYTLSVVSSDKGRKFETALPLEVAKRVLARIEAHESERQRVISKLKELVKDLINTDLYIEFETDYYGIKFIQFKDNEDTGQIDIIEGYPNLERIKVLECYDIIELEKLINMLEADEFDIKSY